MLNCREVSRLVSSGELESAGAVKRLRTRFHLMICRECRRYAEQLRIIGTVAREKIRGLVVDQGTITRLEKAILIDAFGTENDSG